MVNIQHCDQRMWPHSNEFQIKMCDITEMIWKFPNCLALRNRYRVSKHHDQNQFESLLINLLISCNIGHILSSTYARIRQRTLIGRPFVSALKKKNHLNDWSVFIIVVNNVQHSSGSCNSNVQVALSLNGKLRHIITSNTALVLY